MKSNLSTQNEISVIVPVYNSYDSLLELHQQLEISLSSSFGSYEIIFVLDGGTPAEWHRLKEIQSSDSQHVNIIRLNKNFGQHHATYCGLIHATGAYCVTIDDDLQFPPEEIQKLFQTITTEDLDVVYGSYGQNTQQLWRRVSGKMLRKIAGVVGKGFGDATSFRIIKSNIVDQFKKQFYSYIFIDEVLLQFTNQIGYVQVEHQNRASGQSNYSFWSLTKLALTIIIFHSSVAIRLVTKVGLFVSTLVTIIIGFLLISALIGWTTFDRALIFNCSIILLLALILFSLGIIGEFVKKNYAFSSFQPSFVIKEKIWRKDEKA